MRSWQNIQTKTLRKYLGIFFQTFRAQFLDFSSKCHGAQKRDAKIPLYYRCFVVTSSVIPHPVIIKISSKKWKKGEDSNRTSLLLDQITKDVKSFDTSCQKWKIFTSLRLTIHVKSLLKIYVEERTEEAHIYVNGSFETSIVFNFIVLIFGFFGSVTTRMSSDNQGYTILQPSSRSKWELSRRIWYYPVD